MDETALLAGFVRNVLRCGCPEEIVRSVRLSREPVGPLPWLRLDVGGRLLVCIPESVVAEGVENTLPGICSAMRLQRDAGGFNRARLVLIEPDDDGVREQILRSFALATSGDERLILHILPREVLEPVLERGRADRGRFR